MNYSAPKAYFFDCATKSARVIGLFRCKEVRSGQVRSWQRMVYLGAEVGSKWFTPVPRFEVNGLIGC